MGNAARKARKRAGIPFSKPVKTATYTRWCDGPRGLGLTSRAEIITALVIRGIA